MHWSLRSAVLGLVLILVGCSGSDAPAADTPAAGEATSVEATDCERAASDIIERFDDFLAPYSDRTPSEFLADPELAGLDDFQNDVAAAILDVAVDPNDDCTERDLEREVEAALQTYGGQGVLQQYLARVVLEGTDIQRRDVRVGPDDDLTAVLPLLGPGSSVTFDEGIFEIDATILIQSDLVLVGAGAGATVLNSSADTAAIAVLGGGKLVVNDMTINHVGDLPASVLIAVEADLELVGVEVSGGIVDDDGGGGSGIVITGPEQRGERSVTIDLTLVTDNAAAGIAVTGAIDPAILNSTLQDNGQCGICYFDDAAGDVQGSTFTGNGVGVQTSGASAPVLAANSFVDNGVAAILIEGAAGTHVIDNRFDGLDIVGIDVQDEAQPVVQRNELRDHAVAISLRGSSLASVSGNLVAGGDVGLLVGGTAAPTVFDNTFTGTEISAFLHTSDSQGEFTDNVMTLEVGAGIVVEEQAQPLHARGSITGGTVGAVLRGAGGGRIVGYSFAEQQVGIETGDGASPTLEANAITRATEAAVILGGEGSPIFRNNTVDSALQIGVQASGSGAPQVEANRILGGDTGVLVTESSQPEIIANTLEDQNFGVGVSGAARPVIEGNEIARAAAGAISFEGTAGGVVASNTIIDAGVVGIRIGGDATPTIEDNALFSIAPQGTGAAQPGSGDAEGDTQSGAGILFSEAAGGVVARNELFGFVIGIQVSDSAAPTLSENRVDGAGVGGVGILYGVAGGGRAEGNLSIGQQLGFQLSGTTSPELVDNTVEGSSVAGFLIQGSSTASLSGNACDEGQPGIVILEDAAPELGENDCPISR